MRHPQPLLLTTLLLATGVAGACDHAPEPSRTPESAEALEGIATRLYDAAAMESWDLATARLDTLREVMTRRTRPPQEPTDIAWLRKFVRARDRLGTMQASNDLIGDIASLADAGSPIPPDLRMLAYYVRELQIGTASGEAGSDRLNGAVDGIRGSWHAVRPLALARDSTATTRVDSLVARLTVSGGSADYAKLARPLLDDVTRLKAAIRRPDRG